MKKTMGLPPHIGKVCSLIKHHGSLNTYMYGKGPLCHKHQRSLQTYDQWQVHTVIKHYSSHTHPHTHTHTANKLFQFKFNRSDQKTPLTPLQAQHLQDHSNCSICIQIISFNSKAIMMFLFYDLSGTSYPLIWKWITNTITHHKKAFHE